MLKIMIFSGLLTLSGQVLAQGLTERVELMKYAIKLEGALPLNFDEEITHFKFEFIPKAYAYREGETCLILGFKSKYKAGMCRLSAAEGAQAFQKQCSSSQYACNPQVFGSQEGAKPFCVSRSAGRDLSKACAQANIKYVQKKSPSEHLKQVLGSGLSSFDLDSLDLSQLDEKTKKQFHSTLSVTPADLASSIQFTQGLCEDLKSSTKRGHQPFDVKVCEAQLKSLIAVQESQGTPVVSQENKEDIKEAVSAIEIKPQGIKLPKVDLKIPSLAKVEKTEMDSRTPAQEPKEATPPTKTDEDCVDCQAKKEQQLTPQEPEVIASDVKKVVNAGSAPQYVACINELEKHPEIIDQIKDIEKWKQDYSRKTGYWHNLDGKKNFGLLCDIFHENLEEYVFVSEDGYKVISNIKDEIRGAETVSQFKSGNTEYYIVQDLMGNYMEVFPKKDLSKASEDAQADIKKYHQRGGKKFGALKDVPSDRIEWAQSCIKQRMTDYLGWMVYKKVPFPNVPDYNADIAIYNAGKKSELMDKYSRTADQVMNERFSEVVKHIPACQSILSEEDWKKDFEDKLGERIGYYEKMQGILGIKP